MNKLLLLAPRQYLDLGIIVLILALISFWISRRESYNITKYFQYLIIPIVPILALFFGEKDAYQLRMHTIAVLMLSYTALTLIINGISALFRNSSRRKKRESASSSNTVSIQLPLEATYSLDAKYADNLPSKMDALLYVNQTITVLTDQFISRFNAENTDDGKETVLKSFLQGLCYNLSSLFSINTRVHVRILSGVHYQKYVATIEHDKEYRSNMTNMSLNNEMIQQSYSNTCSLVKSLNPTLHENGNNKRWKDYLTFALTQFVHEKYPVFSFGISITNNRDDKDMLIFLNYCNIESIIGRHFDYIVDQTDMADFVQRRYFSSGIPATAGR